MFISVIKSKLQVTSISTSINTLSTNFGKNGARRYLLGVSVYCMQLYLSTSRTQSVQQQLKSQILNKTQSGNCHGHHEVLDCSFVSQPASLMSSGTSLSGKKRCTVKSTSNHTLLSEYRLQCNGTISVNEQLDVQPSVQQWIINFSS